MSKPVESVEYKTDDGREAFALVLNTNQDGSLDLAWLDPDTYQWHAANQTPADRVS